MNVCSMIISVTPYQVGDWYHQEYNHYSSQIPPRSVALHLLYMMDVMKHLLIWWGGLQGIEVKQGEKCPDTGGTRTLRHQAGSLSINRESTSAPLQLSSIFIRLCKVNVLFNSCPSPSFPVDKGHVKSVWYWILRHMHLNDIIIKINWLEIHAMLLTAESKNCLE